MTPTPSATTASPAATAVPDAARAALLVRMRALKDFLGHPQDAAPTVETGADHAQTTVRPQDYLDAGLIAAVTSSYTVPATAGGGAGVLLFPDHASALRVLGEHTALAAGQRRVPFAVPGVPGAQAFDFFTGPALTERNARFVVGPYLYELGIGVTVQSSQVPTTTQVGSVAKAWYDSVRSLV